MRNVLCALVGLALAGSAAAAGLNAGNGSLVEVGTVSGANSPVLITQNYDTSSIVAVQIACGPEGAYTGHNWYLRRFFLSDYIDIYCDLTVESVDFGVQQLSMADGADPAPYRVQLKLFTIDPADTFKFDQLVLVGFAEVDITGADVGSFLNVPVTGFIPSGKDLVVAIDAPDGSAIGAGLEFRPAANPFGALYDAYLSAVECDLPEPVSVTDLDYPGSQTIFVVHGEVDEGCVPIPVEMRTWGSIKRSYR